MSIKPLAMWAIHNGWTLRFSERTPTEAQGVVSTPNGLLPFRYERDARRLHLPDRVVHLDPYGWEVDEKGQIVFRSARPAPDESPSSSPDGQRPSDNKDTDDG